MPVFFRKVFRRFQRFFRRRSLSCSDPQNLTKHYMSFGAKIPPYPATAQESGMTVPGLGFKFCSYTTSGHRYTNGGLNDSVICQIGIIEPDTGCHEKPPFSPQNLMLLLWGEYSDPAEDECWVLQTVTVRPEVIACYFLDWRQPNRRAILALQCGDYDEIEFEFSRPLVEKVSLATKYNVTLQKIPEGKAFRHSACIIQSDDIGWQTEVLREETHYSYPGSR